MTDNPYTILIADRNPHVRKFLKREMRAAGYQVRLAENGREVLQWSYDPTPLDLLILDPDLPDMDRSILLARLADRIPALPMILHTFPTDNDIPSSIAGEVAFVEKKGNSVEHLKRVVAEMLTRPDLRQTT